MKKFRKISKKFWKSIKKFWKRLWQMPSNLLIRKKNYLKEIEQTIELFRFMDEEEQKENFDWVSWSIEHDLVEGAFDNKVYIKYWMRFIKVIKTDIFLPDDNLKNFIKLISVYMPVCREIEQFISELRSVEEIKEDNFLSVLNHEDKINLNNIFKDALVSFRVTINELNDGEIKFNEHKTIVAKEKRKCILRKHGIEKIISGALRKMPEQEKISKLQASSKIFKEKAKKYKNESAMFLFFAGMIAVVVLLVMLYKIFFGDNINLPERSGNVDSSAFYIYVILEILLGGRLLFSVIALAGFFYCLRFYAASNHNAIICDQRANTLESFEALYENVKVGKERLLVVEKVLNSATEHLPTGFSKLQSDSGGEGIVSSLASLFKALGVQLPACLSLCSHSARLAVRVNNAVVKKRRQTEAGTHSKSEGKQRQKTPKKAHKYPLAILPVL